MNDLDDWLNSIGISEENREVNIPASSDTAPVILEDSIIAQTPSQPQDLSISPNDFNDILADNGFQEPEYEEAEEVEEEGEGGDGVNTDEFNGNGGEGRDLDAEEDADWNGLIASGSVTPVNVYVDTASGESVQAVDLHILDGNITPIIQVEDIPTTLGYVEEDYPEHNSDEEVSPNAAEAFDLVAQASPAPEPLIPLNSPTLLHNDTTSRFSGTEWYNEIQKSRIILAGCGGIGSWTALQLARMNPAALFMYDDDVVEPANMSGQLYCQDDVGEAKVDAMAHMIGSYTTTRSVYAIQNKYTQDSEAGDIMICGFDNMKARKTFFQSWQEHLKDIPEELRYKCVYIDGRLSIDTLQVFCITGDNNWAINEYAEKYLFSDSQADATQCSLKQTTYLACMIGSVIVNLFTNFVANTLNPVIPYDLPFFTEYDAQNMIFKTIK